MPGNLAGWNLVSNTFEGFVTAPDGSVYKNITHHTEGTYFGNQTWSELELVTAGTPGPAGEAASTGVNPVETSYSLYGHTVPLSVFGLGRIGGEIIAGPWVDNGAASFCISFGVPADPSGSRTLREIAFDSEVVWTLADGYSNENHFVFRWYEGTLTQAADPLEIAHFGADAVAYRPQMLLWFENLPLANTKFGKIPYVAALIADDSGEDVNLGEAFERLAYSPWVGFTPDEFETDGITDGLVDGGMIIVEQADFLSTIQQFGRFYRNWDIIQTDKLKIVDHGSKVTADLVLSKNHLMGDIVYNRAEANSTSRELILSTIDNGADYTIVPSSAKRPLHPVAVTASVRTESAYLPVIMDAFSRTALVTYTKYQEEVTRKKISGTAMMYGLELEPGDMIALTGLGADFAEEVFKITDTTHGVNHSVEFTAESLFNCDAGLGDPYWDYVVLLLGFEDVDGSVGAPGFTDESPRAHGTGWAAGAATEAQIDTSQSKFGTASLSLGNNLWDQLHFGDSDDWHLSSANSDQFTIECWVRLNETTALDMIVGHSFGPPNESWDFYIGGSELYFRSSADGSTFNVTLSSSGAGLVLNTWYHVAVDKDAGGKIRIYRNGVMYGSVTPANSSQHDSGIPLQIGGAAYGASLDGHLDELRITKGVARYASDSGFLVPASAYPRGGSA